jgi:Fe-S oxidoreductase
MKIGLFMPCYIDMVYPEVGIATLELLEKFGLDVDYPLNQTCCGQPMSNGGDQLNARGLNNYSLTFSRATTASSARPEAASSK